MAEDISIIIVNYNTTDHLRSCLKSIIKNIGNYKVETIVIDNNSPDREILNLPSVFPEVKFFFSKRNDGFGKASNYGSEYATGKYFLFVNPDTIFSENSLHEIFQYMENNPDVALSSGVLFGETGKNIYTYNYFPDVKWEFIEAIGRGSDRKIKELLDNEKIKSESNEALEADWVMGAFMFVKAKIFKEVKGFNETFFLYYEDVDLQKRISNLGYKIVVLPYVKIFHYERSSVRSKEGENIYYFNMNRSKMIYFYNHSNFFKRNLIRLMHIAGFLTRFITLLFRKKFEGKKKQKIHQYVLILKIYLSTKNKLFNSCYSK